MLNEPEDLANDLNVEPIITFESQLTSEEELKVNMESVAYLRQRYSEAQSYKISELKNLLYKLLKIYTDY